MPRRQGLKARVDRRGRFSLPGGRVRCLAGPRCLIRVKLFTRDARPLGALTLPVRRGRERPVRGRLSRPGRALLARRGRLTVRVRVRLAPGRTRTARLLLLAPPRR